MKHLTSDQLLSYQQNKLSNKESLLLKQHLDECVSCQNELELLEELQFEWMNPPTIQLPDDVINEIMMQTEEMKMTTQDTKHNIKQYNSKKVRLIHIVLAGAATFLFFQFELTERITNSNQQLVQTIEKTSTLIEKGENMSITIPIPKILKGNKK